MKITSIDPPREFCVGNGIVVKNCARIGLQPDEQVTFVTESGAEYDVMRKAWGYYATPSLNGRLRSNGYKTALVRSASGKYFVMLVEIERVSEFVSYLQAENETFMEWLDERT